MPRCTRCHVWRPSFWLSIEGLCRSCKEKDNMEIFQKAKSNSDHGENTPISQAQSEPESIKYDDAWRKAEIQRRIEERRIAEAKSQKVPREIIITPTPPLNRYSVPSISIPHVPLDVSPTFAKMQRISSINNLSFSKVTRHASLDLLGNFVAIDVETTGLNVKDSEIIEVAAIRFCNFQPVDTFTSLTKPSKPIPANISVLTGITDSMVQDEPHFRQIAIALENYMGSDNIVGHNLRFDLKFITKQGVNTEKQSRKYFDTLEIAKRVLRTPGKRYSDENYDVDNYKLETLCRYYGIANAGHRALGDCYAAGCLFHSLVNAIFD